MSPLQFLCSRNGKRLLAALLILTFVHMVYSGVYKPLFVLTGETFGQLQEEMEPLRLLIGEGRSITLSNPRQYGPVFLATMMPVLLLTDRALLIERTAWVFCIVAIGIAFVLTVKMLPVPEKYRNSFRMLLGILWFNFSSLYYILGVKGVEAWELLLISIACLALARRKEFQEFHAGIAIAAATLIKLLPGIFFVPLLIRNPKAFWKGIAWLFVLLLMGQFLFGKWIGLAYLPGVLRSGAGPESWAAAHFENNSLKGMVYKWFSGFESMPDYPQLFQLAPETAQAAFICSAMLQVLLMISIVWLLWRERKQQNRDATLRAFGLTSGAMLLLSPVAALEYSVLLLLAFSIGAYTLLFRNRASRTLWALFGSSYLLLGHFVPFAVVLRVLPLPWIGQTMNLAIFRADEIYKTIGLPFLGFLLLFAFFVLLMMHPRKSNISNA